VTLLVALFGSIRILRTLRTVRSDRELVFQYLRLPELHLNLCRLERHFYNHLGDRLPDSDQLYGPVIASKRSLEIAWQMLFDEVVIGNAFVFAAKVFQADGEPQSAIELYRQILARAREMKEEGVLSEDELDDCYAGIQSCYLMTWQRREAVSISRKAATRTNCGCRSEDQVMRWFLCLSAAAWLEMRCARFRSLRRRRPPKVLLGGVSKF
jgi:hypothetical protein